MVVRHTLGKTLVCFCFLHMENFGEKICRCIVHTGGCPVAPLATPKDTAKSWVPYPLVLPWLYFGVVWLALVQLWYSLCIAYGKCIYFSLPNATLLITLHTLVSSLAIPWYNFLGSDLIGFYYSL